MITPRTVFLALSLSLSLLSFNSFADLQKVKTKTFDGEKFVFPQDIKGTPQTLLFLAMSSDQDNGQLQQEQLIEWHKVLTDKGILTEQVAAYHFPVMESPPFFVKGIIRSAMADAYEGTAEPNQSGVLYVDDLEEFAKESGLTLDELPTIVLLSADGKVLQEFKGAVSEELVVSIAAAISPSSETTDTPEE